MAQRLDNGRDDSPDARRRRMELEGSRPVDAAPPGSRERGESDLTGWNPARDEESSLREGRFHRAAQLRMAQPRTEIDDRDEAQWRSGRGPEWATGGVHGGPYGLDDRDDRYADGRGSRAIMGEQDQELRPQRAEFRAWDRAGYGAEDVGPDGHALREDWTRQDERMGSVEESWGGGRRWRGGGHGPDEEPRRRATPREEEHARHDDRGHRELRHGGLGAMHRGPPGRDRLGAGRHEHAQHDEHFHGGGHARHGWRREGGPLDAHARGAAMRGDTYGDERVRPMGPRESGWSVRERGHGMDPRERSERTRMVDHLREDRSQDFRFAPSTAPGRRGWKREPLTAGEVMTRDVRTVRRNTPLRDVARIMMDEDCGVVPIVDSLGRLEGIVTDRDLALRAFLQSRSVEQLQVSDVMTDEVEAVTADEDLHGVLAVMGQKQIRRLPVVERDDRVIGIVSLGDIARRADNDEELQRTLERISSRRSFWMRLR
ncbi:CBS domain-containing protein [Myxococcus stipitatus]|uniref:CBS domain-containing protein n=1 Tax=Myxococcus stipitatus TaxID=83455 RepID=UPI001F47BD57|nr:CBS domain-containing protein [Myxococcus stipitatus]MCE9668304.1 CBS domain-containing protein [Myxococcus stipitatus]